MEIKITTLLASKLVLQQFHKLTYLTVEPVTFGGIDNRTFHLGDEMLIRLPSAKEYAPQAKKEQKWLPKLAPHLSTSIPKAVALGKPSKEYPYHWSIYEWIKGESANTARLTGAHLNQLAIDLSVFLKELHKVEAKKGPPPGEHNFYRGEHPRVYDEQTRSTIEELGSIIDKRKALALWEKALESEWDKEPVWIHGDFASGNIIVKDGKLAGVIDFGCCGVGDPACDLVIAWTFFKGESREIFKREMDMDSGTWDKARAWALWKACFEYLDFNNKTTPAAMKRLQIIRDILEN